MKKLLIATALVSSLASVALAATVDTPSVNDTETSTTAVKKKRILWGLFDTAGNEQHSSYDDANDHDDNDHDGEEGPDHSGDSHDVDGPDHSGDSNDAEGPDDHSDAGESGEGGDDD